MQWIRDYFDYRYFFQSKKLLDVQTDIYGIEKQLEAAKSGKPLI